MTNPDTLQTLLRYLDNPAPTVEEAVEVFTPMTIGEYDDVHIAALLATIQPSSFCSLNMAIFSSDWPLASTHV